MCENREGRAVCQEGSPEEEQLEAGREEGFGFLGNKETFMTEVISASNSAGKALVR